MISSKITLDGCEFFIVPQGFEFTTQSCVKFYGFRLSKKQVITCCEHFINVLQILGYSDRLKSGFNLKCFKYFELTVYLHGLVSLYCSHLKTPCPRCFGLTRFSHLPHDILKTEKEVVTVDCSLLLDACSSSNVYVAIYNEVVYTGSSFESLKSLLSMDFPNKNLVFTLK